MACIVETLRPSKTIFNCYDSFSQANSLNKSVATGKVESDNVEKRNYFVQIFDSVKKGFTSWLLLLLVLFGIWRAWNMFQNFFGNRSEESLSLSSSVDPSAGNPDQLERGSKVLAVVTPPIVKNVKIMTSRTIITADGQVFALGLTYGDFLLISITNKGLLTWKKEEALFLSSVVY